MSKDEEREFQILKRSFRAHSSSGGKDYHLIAVVSTDRSMLIKRWGKKDRFGQMNVEVYDNPEDPIKEFKNLVREKHERGPYKKTLTDTNNGPLTDLNEILPRIGVTVWPKIGKDNDVFLFGDDALFFKFGDAENPEFEQDDNGKWRVKEKPLNVIPDPEPTLSERVNDNPMWGMF